MLTEGMKYLRDAEAIMLDRIERLIKGEITGYKYKEDGWVCNSLISWKEMHMPLWGKNKVYLVIKGLEDKGLIESEKKRKSELDHSKWYRINYEKCNQMVEEDANK